MNRPSVILFALAAVFCGVACSGDAQGAARLSVRGSDTMVILTQRWAEDYMRAHPETTIQVTGGGSGTGLAALINGTTDLATASRPITERERRNLERNRAVEARGVPVAIDAVAVYVHRDNPIESLTLAQLAALFRGQIDDWAQLGGAPGRVVLYSRENSSGTYAYFKERVLQDRDFASEAQTLPGTAAVIHAISRDPVGVGYGGVGFGEGVRAVPIVTDDGRAVAPTAESALDGSYPLSRPLLIYTAGEPRGVAADFIAWARSPDGQRLVDAAGYYPLPQVRTARVSP